MDHNETKTTEEQKVADIFGQIKTMQVEPSPFLKTRVLARLRERQTQQSSLFFWKALSVGSLLALCAVIIYTAPLMKRSTPDGFIKQAYVIHIDFNEADKQSVVHAEIELPKDVHFVTKNKSTRDERKLILPVAVKALGKGKLPFVVSADYAGDKEIKVRLLNEQDQLVREQVLKLKFAKDDSTGTLE